LSSLRLEGCKVENLLVIVSQDKMHYPVTEVADSVEENDSSGTQLFHVWYLISSMSRQFKNGHMMCVDLLWIRLGAFSLILAKDYSVGWVGVQEQGIWTDLGGCKRRKWVRVMSPLLFRAPPQGGSRTSLRHGATTRHAAALRRAAPRPGIEQNSSPGNQHDRRSRSIPGVWSFSWWICQPKGLIYTSPGHTALGKE